MLRMKVLRAAFIALIAVALAACHASYPFQPSSPNPTRLLVLYRFGGTGPIVPGSTGTLSAYTIDDDGIAQDVTSRATWESSNPSVVRATNPTFTAVAQGVADVIATYQGLAGRITASVTDPLDYPRIEVRGFLGTFPGESAHLSASFWTAAFQSRDVSTTATWTSLDPQIATIGSTTNGGVAVIGVSPGNARIKVTANGISATYIISVQP
jgi:hypothetical protein